MLAKLQTLWDTKPWLIYLVVLLVLINAPAIFFGWWGILYGLGFVLFVAVALVAYVVFAISAEEAAGRNPFN